MIGTEAWETAHRLRAEGVSIRAIARRLGIARNTARRALRSAEPPVYPRRVTNVRGAPKEGEARALAAAARADRDRRIRSLAGDGWSHARIGTEVGLSDERVRQILAKPSLDERLDAAIAWLRAEISKLEREEAADRARLGPMPPVALSPEAKALVRQIDRLEEEREARELARRFDLPLAWLG